GDIGADLCNRGPSAIIQALNDEAGFIAGVIDPGEVDLGGRGRKSSQVGRSGGERGGDANGRGGADLIAIARVACHVGSLHTVVVSGRSGKPCILVGGDTGGGGCDLCPV